MTNRRAALWLQLQPDCVVIARSSSELSTVQQDSKVSGASTAGLGTKVGDVMDDSGPVSAISRPPGAIACLAAMGHDADSCPRGAAITGGSPTVVIGDIDTGLDFTHPDLAPNVD